MKPIVLTKKQQHRLLEMCMGFFPNVQKETWDKTVAYYGSEEAAKANFGGFYLTGSGNVQCSFPNDEQDDSYHHHIMKPIHWFEFCLYYLLPKVAEEHGKQPYTTPNWSVYMVKQKIINELGTTNPIDTLYDIWKHPDKYAQTL